MRGMQHAPAKDAHDFEKLLLLLAVAISAVFVIRYVPLLLSGKAYFAEDFGAHWNALKVFYSWPPESPYSAAHDAQYFQGVGNFYHPYLNPPFFLFLLWPLIFLSYPAAIVVWYAAQLAFLSWAIRCKEVRALWPQWASQPEWRYTGKTLLIALPFLLNTILSGQTGILTAAFLLLGIAWLKEKPVWAGVMFSCLAIKPQLLPAVGVLLLFGKHWRALFSYLGSIAVLVVASTAIWGIGIWQDYQQALQLQSHVLGLAEMPQAIAVQFISTYAGLRFLGVGVSPALIAQLAVLLTALAALAVCAYRRPIHPETYALALVSVFLCSPYVSQYDSVILFAAVLLLVHRGYNHPLSSYGRMVVIFVVAGGIVVPLLQAYKIPIGMLTMLALWGLCLRMNFRPLQFRTISKNES